MVSPEKFEELLKLDASQKDEIIRQYRILDNPILLQRKDGEEDYTKRNPFQRDYARILYSPSFRRLQGKMQIVGIKSSAFYRNRLTHSLEVSQIATSIARLLATSCLQGKGESEMPFTDMYNADIHLIEAAALAHDIGHPPFGHKGEHVLNELGSQIGLHFEGNAQNFRILCFLENKEPGVRGLNLCPRTLLAINKYIVKEGTNVKKFMYEDDFDYLQSVRNQIDELRYARSLDVQIIELADDIAYAVHDLEDGLALGNFTLDEICFAIKKRQEKAYELFEPIVKSAIKYANKEKVMDVQEHSKILRMSLTSQLTYTFIHDITIAKVGKEEAIEHGSGVDVMELTLGSYKVLLNNLKKVVFECTNRRDSVSLYEIRGEIVLKKFILYLYGYKCESGWHVDATSLSPMYGI